MLEEEEEFSIIISSSLALSLFGIFTYKRETNNIDWETMTKCLREFSV